MRQGKPILFPLRRFPPPDQFRVSGETMGGLTVAFGTHDAAKNHHRLFQITVGRDVVGVWTAARRY